VRLAIEHAASVFGSSELEREIVAALRALTIGSSPTGLLRLGGLTLLP
jgi:hypothetical protein